ncbi:MAG: hypothetical protein Fur0025_20150 [Oscillatoriaceae cyanobacterium]
MLNDQPLVQIDLTPQYKRNLRELSKKYRRIRLDTQPIIEQLQQGNFPGDRLAGMGEDYFIFKVRVKNTDIQKGKSGGYRLIYSSLSNALVLSKPLSLSGLGFWGDGTVPGRQAKRCIKWSHQLASCC